MPASPDAAPPGRRPARCATLLALALLALQAAWVLTVPPFRGIDEFDHAYRAAAVAHGQLVPSERPVEVGRGEYVEVPATLVAAATEVCETYAYTGPDNCRAARTLPDGYVEVASAAARYNPAFYWLIGLPSSSFDGAAYVYALRSAAALLCASLVWCAGYALSVGSRSGWPFLGLAVAATPVLVYSTSLGAPNGVEMCAGLALWSALLALRRSWLTRRQEQVLLLMAGAAACALVTTRLLGPAWLVAVLVTAAPLLGRQRAAEIIRAHRRTTLLGAAAVTTATGAAAWWTLLARPNALTGGDAAAEVGQADPLRDSLAQLPLWVLQSVAAFPTRSEPAPAYVYAAGLAALGLVGVLVLRRVPGAARWWLLGATVVWLGMQLAVGLVTYQHLGGAWQGRYALPFAVGIPVAAGALAERYAATGPPRLVTAVVVAMVGSAHAVSTLAVLRAELRSSPLAGDPAWVAAPAWLLLALTVLAVGLGSLAASPPQAPVMSRRSGSGRQAAALAATQPSSAARALPLSRDSAACSIPAASASSGSSEPPR